MNSLIMILQSRNVLNVQLLQLLKLHFPTLQNSNSVVALKILATEQPFFAFGLASFRAVHGGSSSLSSTFPGSGRTGKCSYKSQYMHYFLNSL